MRGRTCWPLVWIDGTPMPAGEVDLDAFSPSTIQGIELYLGSTTAPIVASINYAMGHDYAGFAVDRLRMLGTDDVVTLNALTRTGMISAA